MIRVVVELDAYGLGIRRMILGEIDIVNTGTGTPGAGNYRCRALAKRTRRETRVGQVLGHARKAQPVWTLVRKALQSMGY